MVSPELSLNELIIENSKNPEVVEDLNNLRHMLRNIRDAIRSDTQELKIVFEDFGDEGFTPGKYTENFFGSNRTIHMNTADWTPGSKSQQTVGEIVMNELGHWGGLPQETTSSPQNWHNAVVFEELYWQKSIRSTDWYKELIAS